MIEVQPLTDSSSLIGNAEALRQRWEEDGVLFLRDVMDPELIGWAREKYREALASHKMIDPSQEAPVWTGVKPEVRPFSSLGPSVWKKVVAQPELHALMRDIFNAEPVWIPIAVYRTSMPSGPLQAGADIFFGRHQDGFWNEGMQFSTAWIPLRKIGLNEGNFAVAPGYHNRGILHSPVPDHPLPADKIPSDAWRAADFRVGDVLIFHFMTPHATLPNPSNLIRLSLDVRAIPVWAPQPVVGTVDHVDGTDVTIKTDEGTLETVHISDRTYIRDRMPIPRVPTHELQRIAYPGSRVMAMAGNDRLATVLRPSSN